MAPKPTPEPSEAHCWVQEASPRIETAPTPGTPAPSKTGYELPQEWAPLAEQVESPATEKAPIPEEPQLEEATLSQFASPMTLAAPTPMLPHESPP